jgi:hypothetical protein
LYDQHQREREYQEYLAALMPYVWVRSQSKKKVKLTDFMALYGGDDTKRGSDDEYMGEEEFAARLKGLQERYGGKLIKGDK